jgi:hypothetical protein
VLVPAPIVRASSPGKPGHRNEASLLIAQEHHEERHRPVGRSSDPTGRHRDVESQRGRGGDGENANVWH